MKRRSFVIFSILLILCTLSTISLTNAQDFDSISHPDNLTIKEGEETSITWVVSIVSVTTPTYDVSRDGIVYLSDYIWELEGTTGIITIYEIGKNLPIGVYSYSIVVKDGNGHVISDEVLVTVKAKSEFSQWWENWWTYIVFGVLLIGFMTSMVLIRRRGFRKGGSLISE